MSAKATRFMWFLLSTKWYFSWQKYTGQQPVGFFCVENNEHGRPGPIDNSDIVADQTDVDDDDDRRLLRTLLQGRDYVLLPEEGWERLYSWYKGGPVIARKMITVGSAAKQLIVEMFPLCLTLIDSRDDSESCLRLSKKASLRELYHVVGQLKGFEPEKFRVRDYFDRRKWLVLVPSSGRILEDSQLQMDQHILLEVESYGTWSSESSATDYWKPARSSSFTIAGGPSLSNGYSTGLSSSNIYQGISVRESREEEEEEMEDECDDNTKQVCRGFGRTSEFGKYLLYVLRIPHQCLERLDQYISTWATPLIANLF